MKDNEGRSFLHRTVQRCNRDAGELFSRCGADVDTVDAKHNTALHSFGRQLTSSGSGTQNEKEKEVTRPVTIRQLSIHGYWSEFLVT